MLRFILLISTILFSSLILAENVQDKNGDVRVPLENYIQLIESVRQPKDTAPASYAVGQSTIDVKINDEKDHTAAVVDVTTSIEIFENKWTLIPILPYGAAITHASIDGKAIQLVQNAEWLSWSTKNKGIFNLKLVYSVDATRSKMGYVAPLPIPRAASTKIKIQFPNSEPDLAVIPSSNLISKERGNGSEITATIPTTSSILISWRIPSDQPYVISRAKYSGKLKNKSMTFTANYDVELFTGESINLPLMPSSVTLNDVKIDKKPATIMEKNGEFIVVLQGQGKHTITSVFQAETEQEQGPLSVTFSIPRVPISQFDLELSGKKEIQVFPKANVVSKVKNNATLATIYLPTTGEVTFSWTDAIPKDIRTQMRANANIYHAISAEEGVLYGTAMIDYEITHGETTTLTFTLSKDAQINRITSPSAGVSDWAVKEEKNKKNVTVFLDRAIKNNYQLQVFYEQLLSANKEQKAINVPLIKADNMHRQRGIVALLAGAELALKPVDESQITRVGENQLPAFFRNTIELSIAHTFKYTSESPKLTVKTVAPERKQGKYDAQVDTLVSLGEVTMRGSAGVQMDIKTGSVVSLQLHLPKDINVLNVTGPSLRNYKIIAEQNTQNISVEFTQEMTGQFRLEINYEKILGATKSELEVPMLEVSGAEVQHGRIAVEALTAVEVQAAEAKQLSLLEINELPQQLVLKTTNPILLAFKYVNTESPHLLKLKMTRHQELDVQVAVIEAANYQTLLTNDGLAVTTAKFMVRNSRRQFLRLNLPEGSQVWSVFVDGKAEKPANANNNDQSETQDILIKMLNSVSGFPVEVIYATPVKKIEMFGSLTSQLPTPDMVVTRTQWDAYLPVGPDYRSIKTNMDVVVSGQWINPRRQVVSNPASDKLTQAGKPMRMTVPQQGIHYRFEKLYANQSKTVSEFSIRYASAGGNQFGLLLSAISVILIWIGIFMLRAAKVSPQITTILIVVGVLGLFLTFAFMQTNTVLPFSIAIIGGVLYVSLLLSPKIKTWQESKNE